MRGERTTVGEVVKRLRRILGHLSAKDRAIVLEGVDAISELSAKLFEATHVPFCPPTPEEAERAAAHFRGPGVDVIAEVTHEVWADIVGRAVDEEGVNDGQK